MENGVKIPRQPYPSERYAKRGGEYGDGMRTRRGKYTVQKKTEWEGLRSFPNKSRNQDFISDGENRMKSWEGFRCCAVTVTGNATAGMRMNPKGLT